MSSQSFHPLETIKADTKLLFATITGGGAAASCVVAGAVPANSEIVSATYSATGTYTIVFRHSFPSLVVAPAATYVGTTVGLSLRSSAIDVTAKTATFVFSVGGTPTDLATTDTVYLAWTVRNTSKNG